MDNMEIEKIIITDENHVEFKNYQRKLIIYNDKKNFLKYFLLTNNVKDYKDINNYIFYIMDYSNEDDKKVLTFGNAFIKKINDIPTKYKQIFIEMHDNYEAYILLPNILAT